MPANALSSCADVKSIYTASWFHTTLWSYVSAQLRCGIQLNDAVEDFISFFGVEDAEKSTLIRAYYRKNQDYIANSGAVREDIEKLVQSEMAAQVGKLREQISDLRALLSQHTTTIKHGAAS